MSTGIPLHVPPSPASERAASAEAPSAAVRAAAVLTAVAIVFLAAASVTGLLAGDAYRDAEEVAAMFRGYDLTTLVLAVPALAVSLGFTARAPQRDLIRTRLLALGVLVYATYTYAIYVFGTAFGPLLLLHVGAFASSLFALVFTLSTTDVAASAEALRSRAPARTAAALLGLLAVSLGGMWVVGALRLVVTGQVPEEGSLLVLPVELTHLAYVLDLSVLVPAYLLAAVLLWRRDPWGYVLAGALLIAGIGQQVGYQVALVFQRAADIPGAVAFDPVEPAIVAVYVLGALLVLVGVRRRADRKRFRRSPGA